MKPIAVIVAGGSGNRMASAVPKQFLELAGKPVLIHSVEAFFSAFGDIEVIVVLPALHLEIGKALLDTYMPGHRVRLTAGGDTRFHSVQSGLRLVERGSIVFVHDAVRCLVTPSLIRNCYTGAVEKGSAIPAVAVKDSMRFVDASGNRAVDRQQLKAVQTPQTFHSDILIPAYDQEYDPSFTDEATVVEQYGHTVSLVEGEDTNIKVTYPVDLLMAAEILRSRII